MNRLIVPDWPAPRNIRALVTTRIGGFSRPPYDSLNLGDHVGDDPLLVAKNRELLARQLPAEPQYLVQVHGTCVADLDGNYDSRADASLTRAPETVCAVLTADCLPVLFCDEAGGVVAAAHAGWRGLADGILERTVAAMGAPPDSIMAYLGPAIGPAAFEVGDEVRAAFVAAQPESAQAFVAHAKNKWLADLYRLARLRLAAAGIKRIYGGEFCTYRDRDRFYSYRRDGVTGRMASCIWIAHLTHPL